MQQVVVPQFLDVEDKIIGPVSVRQFIELIVGGLIIVVFYKIFDFSLFVVSGLMVLAITLIIAFAKINGQPFHLFLLNFVQTLKNPKLKVWRKFFTLDEIKADLAKPKEEKPAVRMAVRQPISKSRLSEISLVIDTGGVYQGENGINN
ncbi:MAG: PrgI family protein [Patescibacteria group bacterium]|jgi:hypothetical protein